jgi:hypothetical protein
VQLYNDTVQGKLQNGVLREKNGMYGGNVEIIAISEIHKFFISVYFISEDQTTQLLTVTFDQVLTQRNVSLYALMNLTVAMMMLCFQLKKKEGLRIF